MQTFRKRELSNPALPEQTMPETNRTILCGANAYESKYYLNDLFAGLPAAIQEELKILCVLFTEEVGGIFTIWFEKDGMITLETQYAEDDFYYDEVSSGLKVCEVRNKKQDLFESLEMYYKVTASAYKGNTP
jgi:hypothetical protein